MFYFFIKFFYPLHLFLILLIIIYLDLKYFMIFFNFILLQYCYMSFNKPDKKIKILISYFSTRFL